MSTQQAFLFVLAGTAILAGGGRAQDLPTLPYSTPNPVPLRDDLVDGVDNPVQINKRLASDWIVRPSPAGCCGPTGKSGPIGWETYVRTGVAFPLSGNIFGDNLQPGWNISGGGRALFFNPEADKAWVIDVGISNTHFNSRNRNNVVTLLNMPDPRNNNATEVQRNGGRPFPTIPSLDTGINSFNLTSANLSLGREIYLLGNAEQEENNWRAGWDFGGRWGNCKIQPTNYPHLDDVFGSVFLAAHTDIEVPWGACVLQFGTRFEWDYTWTDILQPQNNGDITMFNLLFTGGIRF
jgi:hypothetical protein